MARRRLPRGVIIAAALLARSLFDRGVVAAWLIALAPVAVASGAYARFYMPFAAVLYAHA